MDPRYMAATSKHLEKQNELLWEAYRSMTHELQKLQAEEEMLMRKFYEVMSNHGLTKKKDVNLIVDEIMKTKDSRHEQSPEVVDQTTTDESTNPEA